MGLAHPLPRGHHLQSDFAHSAAAFFGHSHSNPGDTSFFIILLLQTLKIPTVGGMVALSSSSSSAGSEPEQMPSLEEVLADPQRHFPRFLFDSEPLAVMELLSAMLFRSPERGHAIAIECLWCWQDLSDASHSLSPLLDELRTTQDIQLVVAGLRLLTRLLQFAPDRVSKARLRNEMNELRMDELVQTLGERFQNRPELEEPIGDWMRIRAEADKPDTRADADSGTFSGEESEESGNKRPMAKVAIQDDELLQLLSTLPKNIHEQLVQLVRHLLQLDANLLGQTLGTIRASLPGNQPSQSVPAPPPAPPAPPPPPPSLSSTFPIQKPPMPPPPPPVIAKKVAIPTTSENTVSRGPTATADIPRPLRPKALPEQGRRLRHLQWAKVPANAVVAAAGPSANIWQGMEAADRELRDRLDFTALDVLFGCPPSPTSCEAANGASQHQQRRRSSMMPAGQSDCVSLLGARRSLSVNVFLKMCRDTEQLLADLAAGNAEQIGADRLRTLAQLLPSDEEQKILREFDGDRSTLGAAEHFLLALAERIPDHRLRLEAMLFRLDLDVIKTTGTGLEPWLQGAQELMASPALRKVLYILLHLGNYLNHGAGAGNAVGFRLASLWKVEDVKAVGGRGRTLLHFVAKQADNCANDLASQLRSVRLATKSSMEAIREDLKSLVDRANRLESLAKAKRETDTFCKEFCHFLENAQPLLKKAKEQLDRLDLLRPQLAAFYCEPERNFSVEDCFKVVGSFLTRFEKAVEENRQRDEKKETDDAQMVIDSKPLKSALAKPMALAQKQPATRKADPPRRSIAIVEERERGVEQKQLGNTARRRTLAASAVALGEKKQEGQNNNGTNAMPNWPISSTDKRQNACSSGDLEAIVNSALGQSGNPPKEAPISPKHAQTKPALIGISAAAKGRLASNGSPPKKAVDSGGVAKRIDQYEGKTNEENTRKSAVPRLRDIGRVRSTQMNAVVDVCRVKIAGNNQPMRPSPLRRQQTTVATSHPWNVAKLAENGMAKVQERPTPLQRAKSCVQSPKTTIGVPKALGSPNTAKQQLTTPKGTKPKPTLTRQVSTASRPTLINTGSSEKKPKWI